jgi:hypothetical protein
MSVPNPATTDWVPLWNAGPVGGYVPSCRVARSSDQTNLGNNAQTTINWDVEDWDTDGIHDNVTNNTRLTCRTAGKYLVHIDVWLSPIPGAGAHRIINFMKNGTTVLDHSVVLSSGRGGISMVMDLVPGDYVESAIYQDSGSTMTLTYVAGRSPTFGMTYLGPNVPLGAVIPPTYGTTLPATPADGQEAILVDSITNPSYQWRFRYNAGSSSAYKWECIGSTPLRATEIQPQESITNAGWVNLATVGPQVTVPRAGEYDIHFGCAQQSAAANYAGYAPKLGAAAVSNNDVTNLYSSSGAVVDIPTSRRIVRTLAASDVILMQYSSFSGVAVAWFQRRWLYVQPVRVS